MITVKLAIAETAGPSTVECQWGLDKNAPTTAEVAFFKSLVLSPEKLDELCGKFREEIAVIARGLSAP